MNRKTAKVLSLMLSAMLITAGVFSAHISASAASGSPEPAASPVHAASDASPAPSPFADVAGLGCEKAVSLLTKDGIINGYEDGTFRPEADITRAEISKIFGTAAQQSYKGSHKEIFSNSAMEKYADEKFADLEKCLWARPYIGIASKLGIVEGYGSGLFRPESNITYNELVAMTVRTSDFDMKDIKSQWPLNYIEAGRRMGLYDGLEYGEKAFEPALHGNLKASRGDAAIIIYNGLAPMRTALADGRPEPSGPEENSGGNPLPGNVKQLSLEQAINIMKTTGMQAEMAEVNRESDEAIAKGHKETASLISDQLDKLDEIEDNEMIPPDQKFEIRLKFEEQGITVDNYNMAKLQREFVTEHIEDNYNAEMNKIEYTTEQLYYGIIQAEQNVSSCESALALAQESLDNTKKKAEYGMASQIEVTNQEHNLVSAETNLESARNTLNSAMSNFAMLLGYPEGTVLRLTTPLEVQERQMPTLREALDGMTEKNLTLDYYNYLVELTEMQFKAVKKTNVSSSAAYRKAESTYDQAVLGVKQYEASMRTDMINDYAKLSELKTDIAQFESTLALAEKSYRISSTQYSNGMITKEALDKAELQMKQAGQGLANAIASYNLAESEFIFNSGVGTSRIKFS